MKFRFPFVLAMLGSLMQGCSGSVPARRADPSSGLSGVLVRGRLITPSGEISKGRLAVNLESSQKKYRIEVAPMETQIYFIEPGSYRISPTRSLFGDAQTELIVQFNDRSYRVPFPQDMVQHEQIVVKPEKIFSMGILEGRLNVPGGTEQPTVMVALIDDVDTRFQIVRQTVQNLMDTKVSQDFREGITDWTTALDQCLFELQESHNATSVNGPKTP